MEKTVNMLGNTPREMWRNAIDLMAFAIEANIGHAKRGLADRPYAGCDEFGERDGDEEARALDKALELLGDFKSEMKRLVDGAFGEDGA